ncbi:MAG: hypothetical protein IH612_12120 [Desulfofustis sp.]|nr:hypothetical protein [Desulfofustis sp.]
MRLNPPKSVQEALSFDDPLSALSGVVDENTPSGGAYRWAYVCILETNSAGLSILFDRYEDTDLDQIEGALEKIGALKTLSDLRVLRKAFDDAIALGFDRFDASDNLDKDPNLKGIIREYQRHVEEMENLLVVFCKKHAHELAG